VGAVAVDELFWSWPFCYDEGKNARTWYGEDDAWPGGTWSRHCRRSVRLKGALRLTALWISQSALARALSKSGGGEAHVLEERIVEDIARLLGHWGE